MKRAIAKHEASFETVTEEHPKWAQKPHACVLLGLPSSDITRLEGCGVILQLVCRGCQKHKAF